MEESRTRSIRAPQRRQRRQRRSWRCVAGAGVVDSGRSISTGGTNREEIFRCSDRRAGRGSGRHAAVRLRRRRGCRRRLRRRHDGAGGRRRHALRRLLLAYRQRLHGRNRQFDHRPRRVAGAGGARGQRRAARRGRPPARRPGGAPPAVRNRPIWRPLSLARSRGAERARHDDRGRVAAARQAHPGRHQDTSQRGGGLERVGRQAYPHHQPAPRPEVVGWRGVRRRRFRVLAGRGRHRRPGVLARPPARHLAGQAAATDGERPVQRCLHLGGSVPDRATGAAARPALLPRALPVAVPHRLQRQRRRARQGIRLRELDAGVPRALRRA